MNSEPFDAYRPSGKFPPQAPVYSLVLALVLGFPLGFLYAYVSHWIPFVYIRLFLTVGLGAALGLLTILVSRRARVRHPTLAGGLGLLTGTIGLYYAWNAHFHTLIDEMPLLLGPVSLWEAMQFLNSIGSWSFKSSDNVTGIALTLVWSVEALLVLGFASVMPWHWIKDTPYCESSRQWLTDKKTIDTLQPFLATDDVAALRRGDLGPLTQAKPRLQDAAAFARLIIKHAADAKEFCTVRIENVERVADRRGQVQDKVTALTKDLVLPHAMMPLLAKFEEFRSQPEAEGEPPLAQAS